MTTTKAIKTIRSYNGFARFLAECDHDDEGDMIVVRETPRDNRIPSYGSYSPTWDVNRWNGRDIIISETAHRCYQVFDATGF